METRSQKTTLMFHKRVVTRIGGEIHLVLGGFDHILPLLARFIVQAVDVFDLGVRLTCRLDGKFAVKRAYAP